MRIHKKIILAHLGWKWQVLTRLTSAVHEGVNAMIASCQRGCNKFEDEHSLNRKSAQLFEGGSPLWHLIAIHFLATNTPKNIRKCSLSVVSNIPRHVQSHKNHCWFPEHCPRQHLQPCGSTFLRSGRIDKYYKLIVLTTSWLKQAPPYNQHTKLRTNARIHAHSS